MLYLYSLEYHRKIITIMYFVCYHSNLEICLLEICKYLLSNKNVCFQFHQQKKIAKHMQVCLLFIDTFSLFTGKSTLMLLCMQLSLMRTISDFKTSSDPKLMEKK